MQEGRNMIDEATLDRVDEAAIEALRRRVPKAREWGPLEPLAEAKDIAPAPFPFDALGPLLGPAAQAIANDVQAPDALAGGSVLAAASLAVQPLANVVMPHGQRAPLSVFVITAADSGDRKSAVDAVACGAIDEVRKQQARQYANEVQQFEEHRASAKKGNAEATPPTPKSLTTSNATIEGICRLLKYQSSVGVFSPEGGEMLGGHSLRDDKRSSGLALFLKAWGAEALDSMRGGSGLTVLLGRRLALHVLVQGVLLRQLLADPLAQGQGFLARCLISQPTTLAGTRLFRTVTPNDNPAVVAFNRVMISRLAISPAIWPDSDGYELKPRDLPMDDWARDLWIAFYNHVEREQAEGRELEKARPFASKAAEHAARIAAIITLMNDSDAKAVNADAMDGAIQLSAFYLQEHLRLTNTGRQERHDTHLRVLLAWLTERGPHVPKADVLQKSPRQIRALKADGIGHLLAELERRNYVRADATSWEVRHVQT
jgi:hypothetical protein